MEKAILFVSSLLFVIFLLQQLGGQNLCYRKLLEKGHGKMSVAVRACACNERGSACNARAMRMDPVHVRGICGFLYLSL